MLSRSQSKNTMKTRAAPGGGGGAEVIVQFGENRVLVERHPAGDRGDGERPGGGEANRSDVPQAKARAAVAGVAVLGSEREARAEPKFDAAAAGRPGKRLVLRRRRTREAVGNDKLRSQAHIGKGVAGRRVDQGGAPCEAEPGAN